MARRRTDNDNEAAVGGGDYDASDLTVLRGLDAVRKRPGMYIGSTDSRGLTHLLWEILDNSVDEAAAGHARNIEVLFHADGSYEVRDDGRGIPVDVEPTTGLSGLELIFTELHAGGKFGGGSYAASGGLHGVGASVVNALSSRLDSAVDRDGATWTLAFDHGEPGQFDAKGSFKHGSGPVKAGKVAKGRTGTRVRWWPDAEIFLPDAQVDTDQVYERCRQLAFLVPGLTITVTDHRDGADRVEEFRADRGLADFVDYITRGEAVCDTLVISGDAPYTETVPVLVDGKLVNTELERTCQVEVALRWVNGWDSDVRSFVNTIMTPKGGTHVTGFDRALTRVANEALREAKVLRDKDENVIRDDVQEGLVAVVRVIIPEPQFEGQTKEILGTAAVQTVAYQVVADALRTWFSKGAKRVQAKAVLQKYAGAAKARQAARLQRETVRRKNALESSSLPAKLADCRSNDVTRTELFIVEGDSAGGGAKKGRDSEFQALLPIRGKILNAAKATTKQVLDNAECAALFTAIGGGWGKNFDLESCRYQRLIIMCDADVDGSHIRTLLLTLCFHYMRPLLDAGRVYAAMPPLHQIKLSGGGGVYTFTEEERIAKVAELEAAGKKIKEIQRYKGLGEMDEEQLADTTLDPATRSLRQLTVDDAEAAAEMFEILMGNDVAPRKEFIIANSELVDRELLDI
jgi:DNA gyrase subunit B